MQRMKPIQTQEREEPIQPTIQTAPQKAESSLQAAPATTTGAVSMQDYLDEANKISEQRTKAAEQRLQFQTRNLADDVARSLYGRNVGATSGVGQRLATRAIDRQMQQFRPEVLNIQADLADKQLQYTRDLDKMYRGEQMDIAREERTEARDIRGEKRQEEAGIRQQQRNLQNKYGVDPATGQAFGSESEALNYWTQQGYDQNFVNKYGLNKDTGKPFASEQEAVSYWEKQGFSRQMLEEYGINPSTGQPFQSKAEAAKHYEQEGYNQNLVNKYGLDPTTKKPFTSLAAAESYWEDMGYDKTIGRKYGNNPDTNAPFQSESEAVEYWKNRNFDEDLVKRYGINPKTGEPFGSEAEAEQYYQERPSRLADLFNMAMAGQLKGEALDNVLAEFNLTKEDVDIPDLKDQTVENYIEAKIGSDQPINLDELKSILSVTGLTEGEITDETLLYSPSFAQSILSTDDADLEKYLIGKGFDKETYGVGGILGIGTDWKWRMKKSKKNMDLFKKLYNEDTDFRDYVDGFLK